MTSYHAFLHRKCRGRGGDIVNKWFKLMAHILVIVLNVVLGTREMAQWLEALVLAEDTG